MRSRASLPLLAVAAVLLAASIGLKAAVFRPTPAIPRATASQTEMLRRFLVAHAGPVTPARTGWSFAAGGCRLLAFPSGQRGTLDMTALSYRRPQDRLVYVYRGRLSDHPPTIALALDVIAYKATRPARGDAEPSYVVLVARDCPRLPDLPWAQLWAPIVG